MLDQPVRAYLDSDGHQMIDVIIDRGYQPAVILARAGLPLRLVFRRDDHDACSERVVFSSPHLDRRLAATGPTTVEIPAQPPGEVRFTCGMGRYRGRIELAGEHAPSILTSLREQASHVERPVGTALVLWAGSLPLVAVPAVLVFDATAAIAAAGVALVAWIAVCFWASRRFAGRS